MKPFLKVCGMKDRDNISALIRDVEPQYIGFIFYPDSPRYVGDLDVSFANLLDVKKVGVFVDADPVDIRKAIDHYDLDVIQLHGDESVDYILDLPDTVQVWKVIRIGNAIDWDAIRPYEDVADAILFDTKGHQYGGNGVSFDWKLLEGYPLAIPMILSGGIDMDVFDQLDTLKRLPIAGIDINSRFESAPGIKDIRKISTFKNTLKQKAYELSSE